MLCYAYYCNYCLLLPTHRVLIIIVISVGFIIGIGIDIIIGIVMRDFTLYFFF